MIETKPRYRVQAKSRPHLSVVPLRWTVDPDVVRVIAQFEERAQSGQLTGIAVAGVNADGGVTTAYVAGDAPFAMMGAVHHLLRRVSSEIEVK